MKMVVALLTALAAGCALVPASASQLVVARRLTPMARISKLIAELEAKVVSDGKKEGQSYDKYACWCESTLARKAGDISEAKVTIEDAQTLMIKLKGEIATHGADIDNLNSAIAANLASQREAADVREKANEDYTVEKTESEQCIGAMEAAITVLNGAGAGKGFLETMREAQLLSVVAGVRSILRQPVVSRVVSSEDMNVVKKFIEKPQDFFVSGQEGLSAVQVANNPHGDYAPQSTQIQGILKSMYDAFAADLEKDNAEEAEESKSFDTLMTTKKTELKTLQATLERHNVNKAAKEKQEAQTKQLRDDEQAQLESDEVFFGETKAACQAKASDWAERTRLRTEELQGMQKAIQILTSPAAQQTFENATTTLLQEFSFHTDRREGREHVRAQAFKRLQSIAGKYHSFRLAEVAASLRTGGHFDKVIVAIDQMMVVLRKEEQDDIAHRDRCEVSDAKNAADMEDLNHDMEMSAKALEKMGDEKDDQKTKISNLEAEIDATKADMLELLGMRNKDTADFKQALKDDMTAVDLLSQAIVALTKFYKTNKIPLSLLNKQAPEYTIDQDKAPETTYSGDYGGRSSESGGIIAILSLIKEDLEMEIKTARSDDAAAQGEYGKQRGAMQDSVDKAESTKTAANLDLADLEAKIQDEEGAKSQAGADLKDEDEMKTSLYADCSWVKTHFKTRRDKRKAEMAGLTDAKSYLAGVEAGDEV